MKKLYYILIPVTILVLFICTLNISKQYMWSDEIFSFHAAKRILEVGEPVYESGLMYGRSKIYHHLLAYSMEIFGTNELGSRVLNIPFLIGTWSIISIFVYTLLDRIKDIRKRVSFSFTAGLLYFVSNFSIAMIRETRMYSMSAFLLITSIFLIYKSIIAPSRGIYLKWFHLKVDLRYVFPAILILLFALETQPINMILGIGLILFFVFSSILEKDIRFLYISLLLMICALAVVYIEFDTLNMILVFNTLSPDWASSSSYLYYSILTIRNLPFVIYTSLLCIYWIFKKKDMNVVYLGSIVLSFLIFLSFQQAQHERYWQVVIPLIVILSAYSIHLFFKYIKNIKLRNILSILISITLIFHIYLSVKEITEIDTYTPHSLSIHKKLEFKKVAEFLDEYDNQDTLIVGDFHSVYTLYEKGVDIDYLLLTNDDVNWRWGSRDIYMDIPLINETDLEVLSTFSDGYLVIRDTDRFTDFPFERIEDFTRPQVYTF